MPCTGELINPAYDNVQNNVIENFIYQKPLNLLNNPSNPLQQQKQSNINYTKKQKGENHVHGNLVVFYSNSFTARVFAAMAIQQVMGV